MPGTPEGPVVSVEKGAKSEVGIHRKMIGEMRPRQPVACYADHCSLGVLIPLSLAPVGHPV